MKKRRAQRDLLYLSISSFIVVCIWVGSNIYHAFVTSTIQPDLQAQIQPIAPRFDTDIIQKLKSRKTVVPVFETNSSSQSAEPTPTEAIINPPVSTNSAVENQPNSIERLGQ